MKVSYEWVIEEADEHGDIFNVDHADTLDEAFERLAYARELGQSSRVEIALLRLSYDDIGGEQERHYAYLKDGELPEIMESCEGAADGPRVPQRFHMRPARVAG